MSYSLARLGHTQNNLCRCGSKETTYYLLLSCNEDSLASARAKLKNKFSGSRLDLRLLLHTKIGIEHTLEFLRETRICSRSWHLARGEEGEEEEVAL